MIDFLDLQFDFPLDDRAYQAIPGWNRPKAPPRVLHQRLSNDRWMSQPEVIFHPDYFRIRACPAKVSLNWNSYGSDDLRDLVALTVPLILQQLGHIVTPAQERQIKAGRYLLKEVHVAEAFHLVNYSQVEFIERLGRALAQRFRIEWARRGKGFFINAKNRRVSAYFYSKLTEFLDRGVKKYQAAIEGAGPGERMWLNISRRAHLLAGLYSENRPRAGFDTRSSTTTSSRLSLP